MERNVEIDKISDGKAQAFDAWLKEYAYNLLLQPFHLLLYTMLIGSVMDLAANNMLYALVALGFLIPAEKLLRKFFGFNKSEVAGNIVGGMVGGSLAMNALNKLGVKRIAVKEANLSDGSLRINLIYQKVKNTPVAYPRNFAKIKKNPLWGDIYEGK